MNFHRATFVAAYGTRASLPTPHCPEVVFVGRSNVGKSTLINGLTYRKNLARVSSSPGKTTTINFFDVDGFALVDLPGYGYAKVSQAERQRWQALMNAYFQSERPIVLVVELIDIRHDPSALDRQLVDYIDGFGLEKCIALTKADKLSRAQALRQQKSICAQLGVSPDHSIITSAVKNTGIDELRSVISAVVE